MEQKRLSEFNATLIQNKPLNERLILNGVSYLAFLQADIYRRLIRPTTPYVAGRASRLAAMARKMFFIMASVFGFFMMFVRRPRVLFYGTDRMSMREAYDGRVGAIYRWLLSHRIRHGHLIHGTADTGVMRRWWRREGPVIYVEALELVGTALLRLRIRKPAFLIPEDATGMVRALFMRANIIAASVPLVAMMLRLIKPEQFWLIDDTRYWHQLVLAAREAHIRTTLFQHGRLTRQLEYLTYPGIRPETVPLPDSYIVWSQFWAERLVDISPIFRNHRELIRPGGKPGGEASVHIGAVSGESEYLRVLIVHEPVATQPEVKAVVDRLLAHDDIRIIYKIRGDLPASVQVDFLGSSRNHEHLDVQATVVPCDVALGSYSTLLYEFVEAGVPVGLLKISSTQDDIVREGLATLVDPQAEDFRVQLDAAAGISHDERARRSGLLRTTIAISDTLRQCLEEGQRGSRA